MDKLVEKIIKIQLDIKLGRFMEEKLDAELKKTWHRKTAGFVNIPPEIWKARKFDHVPLQLCQSM